MPPISKLRAPPTAPNPLPLNTVVLYQDASWSSKSYTLNIHDYAKNQRHSISGSTMQDKATWIAFNLPEGTVVTMMNNVAAPPEGTVFNLKGCGSVVDLVGTGQTEGVALTLCNMNDCISAWYWHRPDMSLGGVELYEDANFQGNRTVLFLSEWPALAEKSTPSCISLSGWYIADRVSSVRWQSLSDAQMVRLFQHSDGTGKEYSNIKGWGSFKELDKLSSVGLNDAVSSFRWNNLIPKKEVIESVEMPVPSAETSFLQKVEGTNNSPEVQPQTIALDKSKTQTTTVTVTNQYTAGMQMSYSIANEVKPPGSTVTVQWTVGISFSYSRTEGREMSMTQATAIGISQVFNVPPYSSYKAELTVGMGNLPLNTTYRTTAMRWYDEKLDNSTHDPATDWYMRKDTVTFNMSGNVAVKATLDVDSKPL